MNLVDKLASEGHLTTEQVERIGRNVHNFMEAVDKDPALLKEATEKLAGMTDILKKTFTGKNFGEGAEKAVGYIPHLLAASGVAAALGGGAEVGRAGIRALRDMYGKSRAYQAMMENNPQLAEADPQVTERAFSTLYRLNPVYAKDPLIAGTFVKTVLDQERMDIGPLTNIVQAHKFIQEAKPKSGNMADFFMKGMK